MKTFSPSLFPVKIAASITLKHLTHSPQEGSKEFVNLNNPGYIFIANLSDWTLIWFIWTLHYYPRLSFSSSKPMWA